MSVKIGHASIDENNGAKNGNAGDQTGKEVCIRNWYLNSKGWVVLRCKNEEKREKIAEAMEKACNNSQIGYDQNQRDSLFNNVKNSGFDPSETTKNVETDCSALVRVCIAYAFGEDVVGNIRTVSEPTVLVNTGLFTKYTSDMYCKSSDYLVRGDILCTPVSGHTVVVLDDGINAKYSPSATVVVNRPTVKEWQKAAIADGYKFPKYGADGKWGSECVSVAKNAIVKKSTTYTNKNLTKIVQKVVGVTVDGYCGEKTDVAIREYQRNNGLIVDGQVGLNTWRKILGV